MPGGDCGKVALHSLINKKKVWNTICRFPCYPQRQEKGLALIICENIADFNHYTLIKSQMYFYCKEYCILKTSAQ